MIRLEMQNANLKRVLATRLEIDRFDYSGAPSAVEKAFACQLATSVWMRQLGNDGAKAALSAYVMARFRWKFAAGTNATMAGRGEISPDEVPV